MQRKWWAAGALLAAPAVAYGSRRIWLSNSLRGDLSSDPDSNEGLLPNGRIPSDGRIIAKLSEPLAYRHQAYLMHTLVGADRSGASQPPLSYPGSKELYKRISDYGKRAATSWQIDITINQVKKGTFIGMPIGAQIIDPTTTIVKNKDGRFVALKDAKDLTFSLIIPESPPQLLDAEASVIRNRLGQSISPFQSPDCRLV